MIPKLYNKIRCLPKVHFLHATLVSLALTSFLFVIFPLQSVICNYSLFDFSYAEFFSISASVVALSFCILTLLLVVSELLHTGRLLHVLALALFVAAYLETGPLALGLPNLNGDVVVQRAMITTFRKVMDAAILSAVVLAILLCYKWIKEYVGYIAIGFLLFVSLSLFDVHKDSAVEVGGGKKFNDCTLYDCLKAVTYSQQKNVIILVLDSAPAPEMARLVQDSQTLRPAFEGFTGYENNIGMYGETELAMTGLMTGLYVDKNETLSAYCGRVFGADSALTIYDQNQYAVFFHSHMFAHGYTNCRVEKSKCGSYATTKDSIYNRPTLSTPYASLKQILTYRILPARQKGNYFLSIVMRSRGGLGKRDTRNDAIGYPIISKSPIGDGPGSFVVYHSMGVHPPITQDREGKRIPNPTGSKEELLDYGVYVLKLVAEYLETLKARNLYDNSLILILADHGVATCGETESNFALARPMLFVKPIGARQDFSVSSIPSCSSKVADILKGSVMSNLSKSDIETILTTQDRYVLEPFFGERSFCKWTYDENGKLRSRENIGLYSCK